MRFGFGVIDDSVGVIGHVCFAMASGLVFDGFRGGTGQEADF